MSRTRCTGVVLAVPHGATDRPVDARPRFRKHFGRTERLRESDVHTREVFALPSALAIVCYPWSRFYCDPNREPDDLSRNGVFPAADFDLREIYPRWPLSPSTRKRRIRQYYEPYQRSLDLLARSPECRLLLDCHSMAMTAPVKAPDRGKLRPAACIGHIVRGREGHVNGLTAPDELATFAQQRLHRLLELTPAPPLADAPTSTTEVRLNDPFAAGHGTRSRSASYLREPDGTLRRDPNSPFQNPGLQLEVNQGLWCDPVTFKPLPGRIAWMRAVLDRWLRDLDVWLREAEDQL